MCQTKTPSACTVGKQAVVGLVLLNLKMEWVHSLMEGITEVFDESGHTAFLATHDYNAERNKRELKLALSRRNDAVIAYPVAGAEELYRQDRKAGVPLVLLEDFPEAPRSSMRSSGMRMQQHAEPSSIS